VNRHALEMFLKGATGDAPQLPDVDGHLVALTRASGKWVLLTAERPTVASYLVAFRAHFQKCPPESLAAAG